MPERFNFQSIMRFPLPRNPGAGAAVLAAALTFFLTGETRAAPARPVNVLFVVSDDLRAELGCYGSSAIKTPHLDTLAGSGILFERAYCQQAVCNPSRSSVLSGARPDTTKIVTGGRHVRMTMPNVVTLPELFQRQGYHTVSVGKIFHHGEVETGGNIGPRMQPDPRSWSEEPFYQGSPYQQWFNRESEELVEQMRAQAATLPEKQRPRIIRGLPYESANQPDDAYPDGQFATRAIETLRRIKDRPFFLALGFRRPHLPLNCPQKYFDLYPEESIRLPDNLHAPKDAPTVALHNGYELRSYAGMPATGEIPERHARNLTRAYRACVSYMDAQLGRVLAEVDRLGLRDNTIVVFWSDHGYHLGENGVWTKMTNFELAVRVPLIVRVPGRTAPGSRSAALVELVDLYPTLAELCGLQLPDYVEGTSFAPLLAEPRRSWKKAVFSQYPRSANWDLTSGDPMGRSMRTGRFRYTEWTTPAGERVGTELYDLERDLANNVNLAVRPEYRKVVAELSVQLEAGWRAARP